MIARWARRKGVITEEYEESITRWAPLLGLAVCLLLVAVAVVYVMIPTDKAVKAEANRLYHAHTGIVVPPSQYLGTREEPEFLSSGSEAQYLAVVRFTDWYGRVQTKAVVASSEVKPNTHVEVLVSRNKPPWIGIDAHRSTVDPRENVQAGLTVLAVLGSALASGAGGFIICLVFEGLMVLRARKKGDGGTAPGIHAVIG